jgi:maltose O-acetyltransferase
MIKRFLEDIIFRCYKIGKQIHTKRTYEGYKKKYNLHPSFRFNGDSVVVYGDGSLIVGADSYVGSYSTIQIEKGVHVRIGSNCRISHNVRIYTTTSLPDQDFNRYDPSKAISESVEIGDAVWIGANVFINPGIKVGNNSIIGANSVLTKDVPENAIVGGVPAKLIRYKNLDA